MMSPVCQIAARQRGFTLLELLVVLVILALTVSLTALSVPDRSASNARQMGQTLLLAGRLAQSEALAQGVIIALELEEKGYRFLRYQPDGESNWQPFDTPELLQGQTLNGPWRWQLEQREPVPVTDVPRLYFWPDGTMSPFALQLIDGQSSSDTDHVVLWTLEGTLIQLTWHSGTGADA